VLVVILLVGALARPGAPASGVDHLILVVDASAPMTATDLAPDRMAAAAAWAAERAERAAPNVRVSIVRAVAGGDVVALRVAPDVAAARAADIAADVVAVDWAAVARRVEALLVAGESARVQSVVASGADVTATEALSPLGRDGVTVDAIVTLGDASANHALADVRLELDDDGPVVRGRVVAAGDAAGAVPVRVAFQRAGSHTLLPWAEVDATPRPGMTDEIEVPVDLPGAGLVSVALDGDAYPADDVAWLAYRPEARPFRVLSVGPADAALERALGSLDGVEAFRADELPDEVVAFDLVVVTAEDMDRTPATSTLWWNRVPPGAATGEPEPLASASPTPSPASTLVAGTADHPLAVGVDPLATSVGAWNGVGRRSGADVLLADGLGRPLLQARTTRVGREVVVGFDPAASSWPAQSTFPSFIAALVEWARFPAGAVTCEVGLPCRLPRDAASGAGVVENGAGRVVVGELPGIVSGALEVWPSGALDARFVPFVPGRYVWRGPNGTVPVVVTARPITTVAAPVDTTESAGREAAPAAAARHPAHVVWWLFLVGVLAIELIRAGLGDERFLRPGAVLRAGSGGRRTLRTWAGIALVGAALAASWWSAPLPWPARSPSAVPVVDVPADEAERDALTAFLDDLGVAPHDPIVTLAPTGWTDRASLLDGASASTAGGAVDADLAFDLAAALADRFGSQTVVVRSGAPVTQGASGARASWWAEAGLRIEAVLERPVAVPFRVDGVDVPERVRAGERFEVGVRVRSDAPRDAIVRVLRDGEQVAERRISVETGLTRVPTTVSVDEPGPVRWTAEVVAGGERATATSISIIRPAPTVRIVTTQAGAGHTFAGLLEVQGVGSDVVVPVNMPWSVEQWEGVDAAVLLNVPALDLHSQQQTVLQSWVRDEGGGAMILGGENTFGPGGYARTALDEMSPLSSEVDREAPEVAMVFVLDRSGSMQQRVSGVSRLEIAKEATSAALDLLGERSFVGLVAFDEVATTVFPMTRVTERATIEAGLGRLQANGGTAIQPALEAAFEVIEASDSATRHVVLFTDGLSQPGDFGTILARFRNAEITLSTVGIGQGTDANQLSQLARDGGGAFHQTNDFRALPGILAQEALLLSGSPLEEGRFQPRWSEPGRLFDTVAREPPPPLDGYVATTAKPEATLHLVVDEQTPLLGSWRYGLGRVLAFASHGAGRWSEPWLESAETPALWADALGWVAKQHGDGPVVRSERVGDEIVVRVETDVDQVDASAWSLMSAEATNPLPGIAFRAVATSTLEARWPIMALGDTTLRVLGPDDFLREQRYVADRWASDGADASQLVASWSGPALATGGGWTFVDATGAFPDGGAVWRWGARTAPNVWLGLALLVWLATLANRYLVVSRGRGRRAAPPSAG